MPYATQTTLTDRYGLATLVSLTDRGAVATGAVDVAVVNRALADAEALIDLYLKDRYILPLAAVPPVLADIAARIAFWNLHIGAPDDKVKKDYDDAQKLLRDIADGRARLSAAGVEPAGSGGTGARTTDRDRPFASDQMTGFV
jgi:phage gp36-like protein